MQINQQENLNYISKIRKAILHALIGTNKLLISLMNQVIPQECSKIEMQIQEKQNGIEQKLQEFNQMSQIISIKKIPDLSHSQESFLIESKVQQNQPRKDLDESLLIVCYTKYGKKFHKLSCRYAATKIAECTIKKAIEEKRLESCKICFKKQ